MEYRIGRGLYAIVGSGELGVVRRRSKSALDFVDGLKVEVADSRISTAVKHILTRYILHHW